MAALARQGRPAADRRQGPRDRPDHQGRDASFRRRRGGARVRRGGVVSALWTSDEVAQALGAVDRCAPFEANGVTFDSRAVGKGDLFFALSGETTDGHGFVAEAMKRGAAAAVVSRDVENAGGTLIRVPDTMKALVDLGRAARRRSKARIASVTGSVGKTSTKDALRAMLSAQAPTSASTASFNNHVGVPISLARLPREARYGVFEIGMNHPGEIEPLARQVEAHVGVVTNVGPVAYRPHGLGRGDRRREGLPVRRHGRRCSGRAQSRQPALRAAGRPCPPFRRVAHRRLRPRRDSRRAASLLQPAGFRQRRCRLDPWPAHRVSAGSGRRALGAEQHCGARRRRGAGRGCRAGGGDAGRRHGLAGPRRAARPEVRHRHGRASGRELQRQPGVGSRHARHPGAHRAGRAAAVGCWRWATCASWARAPMPTTPGSPTRWRPAAPRRSSCAGRTWRRCGSKLAAGAARRASAGFDGARRRGRGGVAGRRCDRGEGFAGFKNEASSSTPSWRPAAARRDAEMFYNLLYPLADVFSPFNLFRYLTFRSIAAFLTALVLSFLIGGGLIRWLRSKQAAGPADPRRRPGHPSHQEGHAHHGRAPDPDHAHGGDAAVGRSHQPLCLDRARASRWPSARSASGTTSSRSPSATPRACRARSSSRSRSWWPPSPPICIAQASPAPLRYTMALAVPEGCAAAARPRRLRRLRRSW